MKRFAFCLAMLFIAPLFAQEKPPEVDVDAVRRLGDFCQHIAPGEWGAPEDAVAEVMGPPAGDAHKWFVTIYSSRRCGGCTLLKKHWEESDHLKAIAKPGDRKASWAHWNVYEREDVTQAWRFPVAKVTAYPTLLVQTPRSGEYGAAGIVVLRHTGYDGDAVKLARKITGAIKAYVRAHQRHMSDALPSSAIIAQNNPWPVLPDEEEPDDIPPPAVDPEPAPEPAPDSEPFPVESLTALLVGVLGLFGGDPLSIAGVLALVVAGWEVLKWAVIRFGGEKFPAMSEFLAKLGTPKAARKRWADKWKVE